jgi:hypothetical protein
MASDSRKSNAQRVQAGLSKLYEIIDISDEAFKARYPSKYRSLQLHEVLGLQEGAFSDVSKNVKRTVIGCRELFAKFAWIERKALHVPDMLLDYKVTCIYCHDHGVKIGAMQLNRDALEKHDGAASHKKNAAAIQAARGRQADLGEVGVTLESTKEKKERARTLAVASLLSGGNGAAPIPPYSISAHMSASFLKVS